MDFAKAQAELAARTSILAAVRTEPIANVFGTFFIGPILSYFLSAIFLREPITILRTVLLLAGFCGVVMVVDPRFGLSPRSVGLRKASRCSKNTSPTPCSSPGSTSCSSGMRG